MDTSPTSWSKQHQFLAETKSLSSQVLKTSMNGDHTTVLQSFPRLHCLHGEQTFLYTQESKPLISTSAHCRSLSHRGALWDQAPFSWELPAGAGGLPFGPPPGTAFCRLNKLIGSGLVSVPWYLIICTIPAQSLVCL